jgi:hypothetical protein
MNKVILCILWLLLPGVVASAEGPVDAPDKAKTSVAILEAQCGDKVSDSDRKALAGWCDTVLTRSLSGQAEIVAIDRQMLNKVLSERVSGSAGLVSADKVDAPLRPFWAAGVLICPAAAPPKGHSSPTNMNVTVEAVLAQTGQLVAEFHVAGNWQGGAWEKEPKLDGLERFWGDIRRNVARSAKLPAVEVPEVKLNSTLPRLQWMADVGTDLPGAKGCFLPQAL